MWQHWKILGDSFGGFLTIRSILYAWKNLKDIQSLPLAPGKFTASDVTQQVASGCWWRGPFLLLPFLFFLPFPPPTPLPPPPPSSSVRTTPTNKVNKSRSSSFNFISSFASNIIESSSGICVPSAPIAALRSRDSCSQSSRRFGILISELWLVPAVCC